MPFFHVFGKNHLPADILQFYSTCLHCCGSFCTFGTRWPKNPPRFGNDTSPSNIFIFLFKCFGHSSVVHDCWKQVWPNKIFNCLPWSSRNLVLLQKRPALFSECEGSCKACLVRMFYSKMKMLCLWMQMYFWTLLLSTQKVTFQVKRSNRKYVCIHRLDDVMHYCKINWRTTYDFMKTLFAVYYALKRIKEI